MGENPPPADKNERMITVSEGHKLCCRYWNTNDAECVDAAPGPSETSPPPKALVFIAHGFGEHCRWYNRLAKILVDAGFYVFSHDHVGHGKSEGDRVHVTDFKLYVSNMFEHIDEVKSKFPSDTKIFIIGHSMGGTIAIQAAMERPEFFNGVVLIAPAIDFTIKANRVMVGVVRAVAYLLPQMSVSRIDPKAVTRDTEIVKAYEDDPLVWHGGIKTKWLLSFHTAMENIRKSSSEIKWPFIILHGSGDTITPLQAARDLHENAKSVDKTLKVYEGFYHQLHSEPEPHRTQVCNDVLEWIAARV